MRLILLNLVLAIISSFVASYIVLTRKYLRARLLAFILIGASIWSYGYSLEMFFSTVETKLVWVNVQFLGMALTNILPLFIFHFFDKEEWLTKRNVSLALAIPALFMGLAFTNSFHHGVIRDVSLNYIEPNYPLIKSYGWAMYGFIGYTHLFIGSSLVFAVRNARKYSEENWKMLIAMVGLIAIPVVYSFNYFFFSKMITPEYTAPMFNVLAVSFALFTPSDMRVGSLFPLEYASILGGMNDIVVITNLADRVTYVNPAAKDQINESMRIDKDDIVGKKISRIIGENPTDALDKELEFNGTRFNISTFKLPDWRGRQKSICYILRDITDRVTLEKKLETLHLYATRISNTQTMEQIGEITSNALSKSLGFDNGVLFQFEENDVKYVKLWGITSEEFNDVMNTDQILDKLTQITESQIYPSVDDFLIDVGFGASKNFKNKTMALIPIIVEGKVIGILALFQLQFRPLTNKDLNLMEIFGGHIASAIFSLKQNEKLKEIQVEEIKQILEGAGRVSSMVRHDLRGPLQTIRNAAYIVESNPDSITRMAPIINKSVEYIVKILEDLQYQDQPSHYEKVQLNLNTLIEQALTQLIVPENITIHQNLCEDPIEHMLDKIKIQRMLDNLFRNAFEAMTMGGILTISTRKCLHGTEIKVQDTGVGIVDTSKLFTPFHTTKINGMGLGLVSVKQTVEKHSGVIEVVSEQGEGTEFIIRIPKDPNHMGMRDTRLKNMITK